MQSLVISGRSLVISGRSLAISGVALAALMVSQPVSAQTDSGVGAPAVAMPPPVSGSTGTADQRRAPLPPFSGSTGTADQRSAPAPVEMAPMMQTVTRASRRLAYQRPTYGFQLPQSWMMPEHYVDYRDFGLDRPARGFGWSRYHDDLVLTDQWGRVYDVADGYDRGGRSDNHRGRDTDGIAGGVAGAAVGAVAGNVIAGAGSRLAGSLIGGGVGALAGLAIEMAVSKKKHRGPRYDDRASDDGYYHRGGGSHWGGYPAQTWSYGGCDCGGGETVTTTTVTYHGGGGGYMVPRQVVTYENVYAPVRPKYRVRDTAPVAEGKIRVRTKLHTKTY